MTVNDSRTLTASAATATAGQVCPPKHQQALSPATLKGAAQPTTATYSPIVLAGTVRLIELALIALVGTAIYVSYVVPIEGFEWRYVVAIAGVVVVAMAAFHVAHIYELQAFRAHEKQYCRLVSAWTVVVLIAIGATFFAKAGDQFSRVWLAGYYVIGLVTLICFRKALSTVVRNWTRQGRLDRRTLVVCADTSGHALIGSLTAQGYSDVRIVGVIDDSGGEHSLTTVAGREKLGTVDDLVEFARRSHIDLVLLCLPISAESRILEMVNKLWVLPLDIRLAAHTTKLRFRPRVYSYIGDVPALDIIDKPITDWDVIIKWLFDRIIGGLALLCLSPFMLLTAIAIKLESRGPVFFKQNRYGFNNELIEVYKFRSMYVDQTDATATKLVRKGDPRVTRVGAFIRKTSIDELPQLINVVFHGNLSLVGPRPHAVHAKAADRLYDEVVADYFARHRVKPGITGWAQINGWRGETDTHEKIQRRVEHDLYYIENWSVLLDLYILARTPWAVAKTDNAY